MYTHDKTKTVYVGKVKIGGGNPVSVQSMLSTPSYDVEKSVAQAVALEKAGCEIIRAAIPDMDAVKLIPALKQAVNVPIVADIHFDYRLALESVAAGIDKIRINPGNIGDEGRVKQVADACRAKNIPIRIGVNSGSVEKEILAKHGAPTAEALVESALYHASLLEKFDFDDIVLSMKSSTVKSIDYLQRELASALSIASFSDVKPRAPYRRRGPRPSSEASRPRLSPPPRAPACRRGPCRRTSPWRR